MDKNNVEARLGNSPNAKGKKAKINQNKCQSSSAHPICK